MEASANTKYQALTELYRRGDQLAEELNGRSNRFSIKVDQLEILSREWEEYEAVYASLNKHPEWIKQLQQSSITIIPLDELMAKKSQWGDAAKWIVGANLGVSASSAISTFGASPRARAARLAKVSKVAQATRFTKVANMAGKASLVLTVVSVGLDIGLTVVQLEEKKSQLESFLREVDQEIARGNAEIAEFTQKLSTVNSLTAQLVAAAGLQNEDQWPTWHAAELDRIRSARDHLINLGGSIARAEKIAQEYRDMRRDRLINLVLASEPQLAVVVEAIVDRVLQQAAA
ncbi:MAG: hypothetical protein HC902_14150 [Calothrix sp. SM1_5_4]|nr:hypothetical protein [Calothrix sp. SM1_5_4]